MPVDVNDRKFAVSLYFLLDPVTLPMAHLCLMELAFSSCTHHVFSNEIDVSMSLGIPLMQAGQC